MATTIVVGGVPPAGNRAHLVGSFLAGQQVVGFYPGVPAFGAVTIQTVARFGPTSLGSAQAFGAVKVAQGRPVTGVGSAQAFGTVTTKAVVSRAVGGVPSAQAFGALTFRTTVSKPSGGVPSAQAFGVVTFRTTVTVPVGGVASAQAFGTVKTALRFTLTGLGSAQAFGVASTVSRVTVAVGGVASAQSFGTAHTPQIVQVPGLNRGVYFFHIVGQHLSGQEKVGWHIDETLFGRPVFGLGYQIAGLGSAQQFGSPLLRGGPISIQVGGVGSAQAFGVPNVYRSVVRPSPPLEVILVPSVPGSGSLVPVACTDVLLVPAAWTEETLTAVDCEDLVLAPSVPQ